MGQIDKGRVCLTTSGAKSETRYLERESTGWNGASATRKATPIRAAPETATDVLRIS